MVGDSAPPGACDKIEFPPTFQMRLAVLGQTARGGRTWGILFITLFLTEDYGARLQAW